MEPDPHDNYLAILEQISLGLISKDFRPETLVTPLFLASVNSITILGIYFFYSLLSF
jgi:hypothetical protein